MYLKSQILLIIVTGGSRYLYIKVVCNHTIVFAILSLREIISFCFPYVIYCWLKKKMYNKYGDVCKEIINVVGNNKWIL